MEQVTTRSINLPIVDIISESPRIETEEGVITGPTTHRMILELAPGDYESVDISANTFNNLSLFTTEI